MFRKAMDYLGLGPDDVYDDYDASIARERPARPARGRRPLPAQDEYDDDRNDDRNDDYEDEYDEVESAPVRKPVRRAQEQRPIGGRDDSSVHVRTVGNRGSTPTVRPRPLNAAEPITLRPLQFDTAKEIADHYKNGQPVIMNLNSCDPTTKRRLVDFVSGLVYATAGSLEQVAKGVYLVKPQGAQAVRD